MKKYQNLRKRIRKSKRPGTPSTTKNINHWDTPKITISQNKSILNWFNPKDNHSKSNSKNRKGHHPKAKVKLTTIFKNNCHKK